MLLKIGLWESQDAISEKPSSPGTRLQANCRFQFDSCLTPHQTSVCISGSDAALNRRLTQIMRIAQISICGINVICMNLRFRCKKKILSAYKNYKGFEPQTDADYEDYPDFHL